MNNVVMVLGSLFMMVSATANAAFISDNSFAQAGFKDTSTGLVWMEFGINNGQSYNYVSSQLAPGGDYFGWRLPSADEVYLMWQNVASLDKVEADYESADEYGTGQLYAWDYNSRVVGGDDSVWDNTFAVMGVNTLSGTAFMERATAIGFFMGKNGLASVKFNDVVDKTGFPVFTYKDEVALRDNAAYSDFFLGLAHESYSTLLVRTVSVSEPGTLVAFAAVMIAIGWRRTHRRLLPKKCGRVGKLLIFLGLRIKPATPPA